MQKAIVSLSDKGGEALLKLIGHLEGEHARPMILSSVSTDKPKITRRRINFMVDTGSDMTAISKKDMVNIGLSYAKLGEEMKKATGIGSRIRRWPVKGAILRFIGDDNNIKTYGPMNIYILDTLEQTPSLLGRDFIIKYGFKLIYDYPNREFYLEK